jgi:pimeloyl-ACP methyl ester carboxylesterase/lysophospholipase L1-like esterase
VPIQPGLSSKKAPPRISEKLDGKNRHEDTHIPVKPFPSHLLIILLAFFFVQLPLMAAPTTDDEEYPRLRKIHRIVMLGDSITHSGESVDFIDAFFTTSHPGLHLEFLNLGLPSETVSGLSEEGHAGGQFPRPCVDERLDRLLEKTKPDLVIACYGMNDGIYLPFDEARFQKFKDGMTSLHGKVTATGAMIIHFTPPVFDEVKGGHPGYGNTLDRYSDWLLAQRSTGWDVVDTHGPMASYLAAQRLRDPGYFLAGDGVHPGETGHWIIAKSILLHLGAKEVGNFENPQAMMANEAYDSSEVLNLVTERQRVNRDAWLAAVGHKRPGMPAGLPLPEATAKTAGIDSRIQQLIAPFPGNKSTWEGFDRYDFEVDGKPAIVVVPKQSLAGKPWIWRGEFFGAFANADIELVGKGFHLAYLGVPDLFGSPDAVARWNGFYDELVGKHGLAKKAALIGLSRGGLYCYNWAAANPDKVACIYADAAVCDFKSWPGGKLKNLGKGEGSADEWRKLLAAYHFSSDAEAIAYTGNPIDHLKPLADAHIPLLHVYGDADTALPWEENTGIVAERYRKLGGSITVIPKPGVGHHPHGLPDPSPIVDFILKNAMDQP